MNFIYNIKLFLRIVQNNKRHYLINVGALIICIAAFTIIKTYTSSQKSFDSLHQKKDRIYRLINIRYYPTKVDKSAGCIEFVGTEMKAAFPEVEQVAHCSKSEKIININGQDFKEKNIYYTSPSFLKIFTFPVLKSNKTDLLDEPYTCVITESVAKRYFGNENPVGKQLNFINEKPVLIEGILKNVPSNSYFDFDILVSYSTLKSSGYCETCNNKNTFLLLTENAEKNKLSAKLPDFIKRIHPDDEFRREYFLQPLSQMHLNTEYRFEIGKTINGKILSYLDVIALLILLISWFNYISVNTIVSLQRLKENGIKSINGAHSGNIFAQLFGESLIITIIATGIGSVLAILTQPLFNSLFKIDQLTLPGHVLTQIFIVVILGSIVTTLSSYLIYIKIRLKNVYHLLTFKKSKSNFSRTSFIVVQNIIALLLIAFTLLTFKQYRFMVDKELGYNAENLLVINNNISQTSLERPDKVFLENLSKYPQIEKVGYTSYLLGSESGNVGGGFHLEGQSLEESIQLYNVAVSCNFFDILHIEIVAGNPISADCSVSGFPDQRNNDEFVLNETAVKFLGFHSNEEAIGKPLLQDNQKIGVIKGVVKDYHQRSLDMPIAPTYFSGWEWSNYFLVKMKPGTIVETINIIEKEYKEISHSGVFEYYFLNDHFNKQYTSYYSFLKAIFIFTILAVIICCIGMYSLMRYIIYYRTKEIGIRKVNGATIKEILANLSLNLIKWVVVAYVIVCPVAWYIMQNWLKSFAYQTELNWWIFAIAGTISLGIAWLTVSLQSIKAAKKNPVEALRYE